MKYISALFTFLLIGNTLASGGSEHHGSVTDLIAPFVNLSLLLGFLVWKLKAPIKNYFEDKSTSIQGILERASIKAKEAEMMMKMQREKNEGLAQEIDSIQNDISRSLSQIEKEHAKEAQRRIEQLKQDASSRLEAEKKKLSLGLNSELIEAVMAKAKSNLKTNSGQANKASESILKEL